MPAVPPDSPAPETHGADVGDRIYYRHPAHGVTHGRVTACGAHGVTCRHEDGTAHRIPWADVLGHKQRQERQYTILDQGEDGAIIADERGQRLFMAGDLPAAEEEDAPLTKSLLVDLGALPCDCTNHALETLQKAASAGRDADLWAPHENLLIRGIVETFTRRGLERHQALQAELEGWLTGQYHQPGLRASPPTHGRPWTAVEQEEVLTYLRSLPTLGVRDWSLLINYLAQKYLSTPALMADGEQLAAQAHAAGHAQARDTDPPLAAIGLALPVMTTTAPQVLSYGAASQALLEYGTLHACENIVAIEDDLRHRLHNTVLRHMTERATGAPLNWPQLRQDLLDHFGDANRNWRRIAITEAGEMANQGFIAALPPGQRVRRLEAYVGACPWCQKINGVVMNVVAADDPDKNGDTDIWPGKTNIGRSASPRKWTDDGLVERTPSERYWIAAGVQHINCRGRWVAEVAPVPGANPDFAEKLRQRLAAEAEDA